MMCSCVMRGGVYAEARSAERLAELEVALARIGTLEATAARVPELEQAAAQVSKLEEQAARAAELEVAAAAARQGQQQQQEAAGESRGGGEYVGEGQQQSLQTMGWGCWHDLIVRALLCIERRQQGGRVRSGSRRLQVGVVGSWRGSTAVSGYRQFGMLWEGLAYI
eukprot:1156402-Pelagomonas_calceolata.AAC.6